MVVVILFASTIIKLSYNNRRSQVVGSETANVTNSGESSHPSRTYI